MRTSPSPQTVHSETTTNWSQVAVAVFILVLGTLVYVLDRPADSVPFFSGINMAHVFPEVFGRIGESLPTFTHVFAFSLLSAAWFGGSRRIGLAACLVWFAVDAAFEIAQQAWIAQQLGEFIPTWFDSLPILNRANAYFISGTFDTGDLISIALGATAAYLVIRSKTPKSDHHE